MYPDTPTICNYCEGQAFDKGRCLSCGAASWKYRNTVNRNLPNQQSAANGDDLPQTGAARSDSPSIFDLIDRVIRLVEKIVSSVLTIIKYKLIFFFSFFALVAIVSSFSSDDEKSSNEGNSNRVSLLEYQPARSGEATKGTSMGTWNGERFKPMPPKPAIPPTPTNIVFNNQQALPFSIPDRKWGEHFNPTKLVPESGFLAFYFDRSNASQLVHPVHVNRIGIDYSRSDFRGIPSNSFGAYWVGVINTEESDTIEVIADKGWNEFRVIIDGAIVQEYSRGSEPAKLVKVSTSQKVTQRAHGEKIRVMAETIDKVYPKSKAGNPLVTLTPGDHLVEIELQNNWHTTDFSAKFKKIRTE